MRKESEFRQYHCRNSTKVGERKRKSGREKFLIFGNTITKIPFANTFCPSGCSKCECAQRKTKCGNGIAEIEKKKLTIVAMPLPKLEGKKIVVAKITCEELKKKSVTFTIFSQQITGN